MIRLLITAAVLGVILLIASCSGMTVIDPGYRGIKVTNGVAAKDPLSQGRYFYNPFLTNIHEISVQSQNHQSQVTPNTKDLQRAVIDYSFNVSLNPVYVGQVFNDVRENWYETYVATLEAGSIAQVATKYDAADLNEKRGEAELEMEQVLKHKLAARLKEKGVSPDAIQISGLSIKSIAFSEEYMTTVEQKATAVQQAEKAKNDTVTITEREKQKVIIAQADADSQLAKAKAEAEGIRIKNEALSQSPKLIDLTYAEAAKVMAGRWSGRVPEIVVNGGEGGNAAFPFLNLTDMVKSRQ